MKTIILLLTVISSTVFANDEKYIEQMMKNIDAIYKAQSSDQFLQSINAFERIGNAEKTKWEPFYYASFGYLMLAVREQDGGKKDQFLDLAASTLDKAKSLKENESEIIAMEGFIHMIRVTVDPATRGPQFSGLAMQSFGKAIGLNPENPRALALMAQMQYGMAQFFKSSTAEACDLSRKALEKFATAKSDQPLVPAWGKAMTEEMVKQCQ